MCGTSLRGCSMRKVGTHWFSLSILSHNFFYDLKNDRSHYDLDLSLLLKQHHRIGAWLPSHSIRCGGSSCTSSLHGERSSWGGHSIQDESQDTDGRKCTSIPWPGHSPEVISELKKRKSQLTQVNNWTAKTGVKYKDEMVCHLRSPEKYGLLQTEGATNGRENGNHRTFEQIPNNKGIRLILLPDIYKLSPYKFCLVFHDLLVP